MDKRQAFAEELRHIVLRAVSENPTYAQSCAGLVSDLQACSPQDLASVVRKRVAGVRRRIAACWFLGQLGWTRAVPSLLEALMDGTSPLSWEAAKSLVKLGGKRAVTGLVRAVRRPANETARAAAIYALGLLGNRAATNDIRRVLSDRRVPPETRAHAAEALGNLGSRRAVKDLIAALSDRSSVVRFWSAYALGELGERTAVPKLRALAASDNGRPRGWWSVSREAAEALRQIEGGATPSGR